MEGQLGGQLMPLLCSLAIEGSCECIQVQLRSMIGRLNKGEELKNMTKRDLGWIQVLLLRVSVILLQHRMWQWSCLAFAGGQGQQTGK